MQLQPAFSPGCVLIEISVIRREQNCLPCLVLTNRKRDGTGMPGIDSLIISERFILRRFMPGMTKTYPTVEAFKAFNGPDSKSSF